MSNYHEILASFYIEPGITNDGAYDENSDTTPAMDIIALVKDSPTEDHFILLGKQGGGSAYYGTIVDKHGTDVAPRFRWKYLLDSTMRPPNTTLLRRCSASLRQETKITCVSPSPRTPWKPFLSILMGRQIMSSGSMLKPAPLCNDCPREGTK